MKVPTSSLVILKGKYAILELSTHYVAGTQHQLRTLRQLMDPLPSLASSRTYHSSLRVVEEEDEDEIEDE